MVMIKVKSTNNPIPPTNTGLNRIKTIYEPKARFVGKSQNIPTREETKVDLVRHGTSKYVRGPVAIIDKSIYKKPRRSHIYPIEKLCRDKVIAHTPEGKRIFAYNDRGMPICFSRRPGKPEDLRCQSTMTHPNGRCKRHGGKAHKGEMHWNAKHLRSSDSLPKYLQNDLRRAEDDPDLLNLAHELHLNDLRSTQLKRDLEVSRSETALRRTHNLITTIDKLMSEGKEVKEEVLEMLVKTWQEGRDEKATWREISSAAEERRKLVETAHRREKDLNLMMKSEQAMALVTSMAAAAKQTVSEFVAKLEESYTFVERDSGNQVQRLPPSWRLEFLSSIGIKIQKMVSGKAREDAID